jgi:Asp-tRNA(Asn)/Glu-tRNA(Gln) amidotransferase A subunit family amidase
MSVPIHALGLSEAIAMIAQGKLSARALADAELERIAVTDDAIEAWATLDPERVRAAADRYDRSDAHGTLGGIGVGLKDIIATAKLPTGMGSNVFAGNHPTRDAACVDRLRAAGAFVFGKTVTTELAFMHPGKTRNPWNRAHTPGGSSSGSAAAVAAGHVTLALGTQTNGSIVRPAAFCGVVGFKPTFGAIPFEGVNLFSESLDTLGTFTRSVADAARAAAALADAGRISPTVAALDSPPRIVKLPGFPWTQIDREVESAIDSALATLAHDGAEIVAKEFPPAWRDAAKVHRTIMLYEAAHALGDLQARERARLSQTLNAALDEGHAIGEDDYRAARTAREQAIAFFGEWSGAFDAIASPPAPSVAPPSLAATGDPACCTLWSLTGFPAITLPVARASNGLPLGLQLAAATAHDDRLLSVAAWCEARLSFQGLLQS